MFTVSHFNFAFILALKTTEKEVHVPIRKERKKRERGEEGRGRESKKRGEIQLEIVTVIV